MWVCIFCFAFPVSILHPCTILESKKGVHLLIRIPVSILHPCKILESNSKSLLYDMVNSSMHSDHFAFGCTLSNASQLAYYYKLGAKHPRGARSIPVKRSNGRIKAIIKQSNKL